VEEIGLFYLGESFMAPSLLVDAIKWCKSIGIPYTFLTTNGSLCTPNSLWAVMEAGLDSLKFSVNAGDFAQFREVMGVKPALYKNALSAIRMARDIRDSYGFKTGIYASSIQYDGAQQEKMEKLLDEHVRPYVDEHYWLPLYSMGSLATERERELGYRPTAGNQGRLGALREPLPCWSAFTEGHVTADGYLSACCFDADARWKMGDLNKQTFMQAWGSPEFVKLREAHLRKDVKGTVCEQCVAYG
jgi:radical SAM protein with 4Fe4S-binding SPASM domain